MKKLLQVDFDFSGPFGAEMAAAMSDLAHSINQEPGVIWKMWTEDKASQKAGGLYLFESEETAKSYLDMHKARLEAMGIQDVRGFIFDINQELSAINNAPV